MPNLNECCYPWDGPCRIEPCNHSCRLIDGHARSHECRCGETTPSRSTNLVPTRCPECREFKPDDDRVKAGMKCAACAYMEVAGRAYERDRENEAIGENR